jgi:ankyrin repeat protein
MKHLLITTIAAVVLLGCGPSAPDISIHKAARQGNIEAVKQHLAAGMDVNAKGDYDFTPLHKAAGAGHKEVAKLLIANGADVNAKDVIGQTPLLDAAGGGHKEVVELLIAKGADVNAKDKYGRTPLHSSIGKIGKGNKEVVELLIAKGADVNAKDDLIEWTPLFMAVEEGHKEIVELLITADADVNAKGFGGNTPLDLAIFNKDTKVANLLRKHGGKTGEELPPSTLFEAASRGALQEVKDFLAKGADVNAKKAVEGESPLHCAALYGHKEVVELLIAEGADVNAQGVDGETPLDWADGETADLLRKHGGKTVEEVSIHVAAKKGNIEAVRQHLDAGTDVNAKGKYGTAPLHYAAGFGQKEVAELLIAKGANVNAKDEDGETPLDRAIEYNHPEIADLLRKHGGKTGEELKAEGAK